MEEYAKCYSHTQDAVAGWQAQTDWEMVHWCQQGQVFLHLVHPVPKASTITLGQNLLKEDEEATYLGVTTDKRQTWKPHIAKAQAKARQTGYPSQICWYHLGSKGENSKISLPGNSQIPLRLAPQCGHPQWRQTSRSWTRLRIRHSVWSLVWCGPHWDADVQGSLISRSKVGCKDSDAGRQVQIHAK